VIPDPAAVCDPPVKQTKPLRLDAADAVAAVFFRLDQTARLEHPQVAENHREAEWEWFRKPTHRRLPIAESLDHEPTRRVGEGVKYLVEGHTVEHAWCDFKSSTRAVNPCFPHS
jgi:hypothetical protein